MSGNIFGENFMMYTWGESHGKALGVVIDGIVSGVEIDYERIKEELDRRKPGQSEIVTSRMEPDNFEILSGILDGKTTGTPISIIVWNKDVDSSQYDDIKHVFRPGHADFGYYYKYGVRDHRGGGRSSGRETVTRVIGGAIAKSVLSKRGITIQGYVKEIAGITATKFDPEEIEKNPIRCPDKIQAKKMIQKIIEVKKLGDSVGGIVEVIVKGVDKGLGDPVFDKLDANLAKAVFSIGAVKGVEIGAGFEASKKLGSENNDQIGVDGFDSNNAGGVLGGISTGQDIVLRAAIKPTPSVSIKQKTIDKDGKQQEIQIKGRHDPCICPRIVPVIESMIAIVIVDALLKHDEISDSNLNKETIRLAIDRVDNLIVNLLGRRHTLSSKMGKYKMKYNLSIDDEKREHDLIVRKKQSGAEYQIDGTLIEKVFRLIINDSKRIQRELIEKSKSDYLDQLK